MHPSLLRAQAYQVLALNDEMFKNGYVSREEHDFIRRLQAKKLTNLALPGTIGSGNNQPI